MPILNSKEWDQFIQSFPQSHIMQTSKWGEFKSHFGWKGEYVVNGDSGAQILFRILPLGMSIAYIPKGPVGSNWKSLWQEVDRVCKKNRAIFLKIEPDDLEPIDDQVSGAFEGFAAPSTSIQPRRTILISLEGSESDWLARMKPKTRYNIRLAEKKGVTVQSSSDVDKFFEMMIITGSRDEFGVHNMDYFRKVHQLFSPEGKCVLLEASFEGQGLAGLLAFRHQKRAWYFYGASNNHERNRMPTYLLQWEAMRWAARNNCLIYDLWGIPDMDETSLEDSFLDRSEDLWGVYRFKRGFGGEVVRSVGAFDRVYQPGLYQLFRIYQRLSQGSMG